MEDLLDIIQGIEDKDTLIGEMSLQIALLRRVAGRVFTPDMEDLGCLPGLSSSVINSVVDRLTKDEVYSSELRMELQKVTKIPDKDRMAVGSMCQDYIGSMQDDDWIYDAVYNFESSFAPLLFLNYSFISRLLDGLSIMKFGPPLSDDFPEVVSSYECFIQAFQSLYPGMAIDFAVRGASQPHAPKSLGYPGVVFLGSPLSVDDACRVFPFIHRLKDGTYKYLGTYKYVNLPLSPEEWEMQIEAVRWEWANYFASSEQEEGIHMRVHAAMSSINAQRIDSDGPMAYVVDDEEITAPVSIMSAWNMHCAIPLAYGLLCVGYDCSFSNAIVSM